MQIQVILLKKNKKLSFTQSPTVGDLFPSPTVNGTLNMFFKRIKLLAFQFLFL